jgi:hypothetical protein
MSHSPLDAVLRHVPRLASEEAQVAMSDTNHLQRFAEVRSVTLLAEGVPPARLLTHLKSIFLVLMLTCVSAGAGM